MTDIRGEAAFRREVLEGSKEGAVIVDFWAPWCAPCRVLGPILERVVASLGDAARLVKLNVDEPENQPLATRYGIQGIPAVKIFRGGELVDEFVGVLPEAEVRRRLEAAAPTEADALFEEAEALFEAGHSERGREVLEKALARSSAHPAANLRMGRLWLEEGRLDEARACLGKIAADAPQAEEAAGLLARIGFIDTCMEQGGRKKIEEELVGDPDNLDLHLALAACLAAEERYEEALEKYLQAVERDKHYREDAARKAMLGIFALVGPRTPLAETYRDKLARVLYS